LVDTYKAIEKSLNFTLKKLNYPEVSYKEVKRKVGGGDKKIIQNFFHKKDIDKALIIYQKHHKKAVTKYSKLRPYAKSTLSLLKKKKKIVAVASNRPKHFTHLILKKLSLEKYLDFVLCTDQINSLKPNPKIINEIIRKFKIEKRFSILEIWILI
jgi:phosphoglycolate phosphatase